MAALDTERGRERNDENGPQGEEPGWGFCRSTCAPAPLDCRCEGQVRAVDLHCVHGTEGTQAWGHTQGTRDKPALECVLPASTCFY